MRVREAEDEFVDYAVDADCAGNEREGSVGWVGEDEVVGVEGCEAVFAYAAAVSTSAQNKQVL